jgi:glycerophosphoryl diester phosphodiesterase
VSGQALYPGLRRPLLFAHRGASLYAPENTLAAFEVALRLGADVIETDVHLSRDGEIVVIHDASLERTTDGHGAVREQPYGALARLDAGYRFRSPSGEPLFRGQGVALPRLGDLFERFPQAAFNIELKQKEPSMVRAVLALLEKQGAARVLLAATDDAIMRELEETRPGVALGLSKGQVMQVVRGAWMGRVPETLAGRALQIPPRYGVLPLATARLLAAAHGAGLEVHLWTVNDPLAARAWVDAGYDGIMSDDPGALAAVIAEAQRR